MTHSSRNTVRASKHSSKLKGNVVLSLGVFKTGRLKISNFICFKIHYHKNSIFSTFITSCTKQPLCLKCKGHFEMVALESTLVFI